MQSLEVNGAVRPPIRVGRRQRVKKAEFGKNWLTVAIRYIVVPALLSISTHMWLVCVVILKLCSYVFKCFIEAGQ